MSSHTSTLSHPSRQFSETSPVASAPFKTAPTQLIRMTRALTTPSTLQASSSHFLPGSLMLPLPGSETLLLPGGSGDTMLCFPGQLHYPQYGTCSPALLGGNAVGSTSIPSGGMSFSTALSAQHFGAVASSTLLPASMATTAALLRQSSSITTAYHLHMKRTAVNPPSTLQRAPKSFSARAGNEPTVAVTEACTSMSAAMGCPNTVMATAPAAHHSTQAVDVELHTVATVASQRLPLNSAGSKRPRSLAEAAELVVQEMDCANDGQGELDEALAVLGKAHGMNTGTGRAGSTADSSDVLVKVGENSRPGSTLPQKKAALVRAAHYLLQQMSQELESAKEEESEEGGTTKALNNTTKAGVCTWGEDMLCSRRKRLKGAALLLLQELDQSNSAKRMSCIQGDQATLTTKKSEETHMTKDLLSLQLATSSREGSRSGFFPFVARLSGMDGSAAEKKSEGKRETSRNDGFFTLQKQHLQESHRSLTQASSSSHHKGISTCEEPKAGVQENVSDTKGKTICASSKEKQWPVLFGITLMPADA